MNVALLVKTSNEWSRNILLGVAQYADEVRGWRFVVPQANAAGEVNLPEDWQGDGIICRLTSESLKESIVSKNVPSVNISWLGEHSVAIPKVVSCQQSCAKMAINFLLDRQFEHFGFVGFQPAIRYPDVVESTITEIVKARGLSFEVFDFPCLNTVPNVALVPDLSEWLRSLAKPVAIVCWSSAMGHLVTLACETTGLRVPEDVSLLCIEHDQLFSSLAPVPLTNLDQDPWRIGYTAAKLLHELIDGGESPENELRVQPISVIPRISTEATAVSDPVLAKALRYIYDRAKDGVSVGDVVSHVRVSRRALETRFREHLDSSPAAYMKKIQLQYVARLLRTTKLTVSQIAVRSGFEYPEVMMRVFKKEYSMTPLQFRYADSTV